ncbi:MAG: archaellin/type IV pilin N-terminal domain-containing protein [Nitrososphaerales archaeon]
MLFHKNAKRRALSPVLAEVTLIAITLVAAVALSGWVFGLMGSLSSGAHVEVQTTLCTGGVCTLTLSNTGGSPASVVQCSIYGAAGTVAAGNSVPAGSSSASVLCVQGAGSSHFAGTRVSGALAMSNGMSIPFSGVWS